MFNINDVIWFLEFVEPDDSTLIKSDNSFALGVCDDNTKTIYINNKLKKDKLKRVLCHEITHAAMFSYGVDISLEQEEFVADLIATYGEKIISITNEIFKKIRGA